MLVSLCAVATGTCCTPVLCLLLGRTSVLILTLSWTRSQERQQLPLYSGLLGWASQPAETEPTWDSPGNAPQSQEDSPKNTAAAGGVGSPAGDKRGQESRSPGDRQRPRLRRDASKRTALRGDAPPSRRAPEPRRCGMRGMDVRDGCAGAAPGGAAPAPPRLRPPCRTAAAPAPPPPPSQFRARLSAEGNGGGPGLRDARGAGSPAAGGEGSAGGCGAARPSGRSGAMASAGGGVAVRVTAAFALPGLFLERSLC